MHDDETPTAIGNQQGGIEGIQRMDLLGRRFSEDEIQRLARLQLLHREQPDALDRSLEEGRLRFARWLVEHGKLGEDDGTGCWRPPWEEGTPSEKWPQGSRRTSTGGNPSGGPCHAPMPEGVGKTPREEWRLSLLGAWSWLREGSARVFGIGRALGSPLNLPGDVEPWGPYGPYGAYGGARSCVEARWYWLFLRHAW